MFNYVVLHLSLVEFKQGDGCGCSKSSGYAVMHPYVVWHGMTGSFLIATDLLAVLEFRMHPLNSEIAKLALTICDHLYVVLTLPCKFCVSQF